MDHNEENNVYATNIKDEVIHISQAKESGRKGYFCLGCKREMQAVLSKKANRISYFRHDPKAVKGKGKCTYSDETHRHKLAKDILQRVKKIKVPALYKYPPKGEEGQAILISEAKFIEAYSVANERSFYENDEGEIKWGRKNQVEEKNLLIRPDVTFFDKDEKPILFIEIVVSHKIKDDKKIKLKRLGVDTVQVIIPKGSPEDIEKTLSQSTKTKWIYNYEQERTEYIPVSSTNTEGIPPIDEEQRKLFEESFSCRKSQINNLIRTIKRCLESKPYADIERSIGDELSRLERNTERDRERLQGLQDKLQKELDNRYKEEYRQLEIEQKAFETEEEGFRIQLGDLENRYFTKRDKLEAEESIVKFELSEETKSMGGTGKSFEDRGSEIAREKKGIEHDIELEGKRREKLPDKCQQIEEELRIEFEGYEELERPEIERIHAETEKLSRESYEGEISEIGRIGSIIKTIKNENYRGIEKSDFTKLNLGQKHKELFINGELLHDYEKQKRYFNQLEAARKFLRSGAYKNWVQ